MQVSPTSVALFLEARSPLALTQKQLDALRSKVEQEMRVTINPVVVFPKRTLPKTTSGKVRRKEVKRRYFGAQLPQPLLMSGQPVRSSGLTTTNADSTTTAAAATFSELLREYGVGDMTASLAANGVDSLRLAKLMDEAKDRFGIIIDATMASTVPAGQLAVSSASTRELPATAIPTSRLWQATLAQAGPPATDRQIKMFCASQFLGVALLVVLCCGCVAVAAAMYVELVAWLLEDTSRHDPWLTVFRGAPGLALMLAPIGWMVAWTVVTIAIKWTCVGRYKKGFVPLWSRAYWRWWFVSRVLRIWETFVGKYLLGTPYLNIMYRCLGCRHLPLSVRLNNFVREVDLFTAGPHAQIDGQVLCSTWSARGILFGKVRINGAQSLPVEATVYPSEVYVGNDRLADLQKDHEWWQRTLCPLVVLAAFSTCSYVSSWLSITITPLEDDDLTGRVVFIFLSTGMLMTLVSAWAGRILAVGFLVDRCYISGLGLVFWFIRDSPLVVLLFKLMGARVSMGTQANHPYVMLPSSARRVHVGRGAVLSGALLRPAVGKCVVVGDHVTLGHSARLRDCVVEEGASVGTNIPVPNGTVVPRGVSLLGFDAAGQPVVVPTSKTREGSKNTSRCHIWAKLVLVQLVRVVVLGMPMASGFSLVLWCARRVVDGTDAWPVEVQAAAAAATVMAVGYMFVVLFRAVLMRVFVPCGTGEASLSLFSVRTTCWGVYNTLNDICFLFTAPFVSGSMLQGLALMMGGVHFDCVWNTVMLDTFAMDGPRCRIGASSVLIGGAIVGHYSEHGMLYFRGASIGAGAVLYPGARLLGGDSLPGGMTLACNSKLFRSQAAAATPSHTPPASKPKRPRALGRLRLSIATNLDVPPSSVFVGSPAVAAVVARRGVRTPVASSPWYHYSGRAPVVAEFMHPSTPRTPATTTGTSTRSLGTPRSHSSRGSPAKSRSRRKRTGSVTFSFRSQPGTTASTSTEGAPTDGDDVIVTVSGPPAPTLAGDDHMEPPHASC